MYCITYRYIVPLLGLCAPCNRYINTKTHFDIQRTVHRDNRSQRGALFLNFILVNNSKRFEQTYCPSLGVLILYSQQLVFVLLET